MNISPKSVFTVFAFALLLHSSVAAPAEDSGQKERRDALLNAVAESQQGSGKSGFWVADTLFELDKTEEALKVVNKCLDSLEPGNKFNRWMHGGNTGFIAWPGIDTYTRYESRMDKATKERYRTIYCGGVFYRRLTTSNHVIMAAVNRYLATEAFGANSFKADPWFMKNDPYIQKMTAEQIKTPGEVWGTNYSSGDPTAEKQIRKHLENVINGGPGEYASRPYGAQNILPLLTLAECVKDPQMRNRAQMAYEYAIIQLAPCYLHGHLATFAPRSYPDMMSQSPWGIASIPWYYFGGVTPGGLDHAEALRAATSHYQLPEMLRAIGTDRSAPYTYRALANKWALTHYVNKTYALFCRSPKAQGWGFAGQSYACGVMWDEPDTSRASQLWVTNPVADRAEGDASNLTNGIHTHGVSRNENQVLHKDAWLSVYRIDPSFRNPYVLGYIPGGYRAAINDSKKSGHIFLHYGSVMIAITAPKPFDWDPSLPIKAPAGKPHEGDSEFRIMETKTAVAIETDSPLDAPAGSPQEQLEAFRKVILAKSKIGVQAGDSVTGTYTDRLGNTLSCTYNSDSKIFGEDKINGKTVDYKNWPGLESPWAHQPIPGGPLTVTVGKKTRIYDYANWTVTEK